MTGQVHEVGPGCYVWLRLPGSWGETNIGLVALSVNVLVLLIVSALTQSRTAAQSQAHSL